MGIGSGFGLLAMMSSVGSGTHGQCVSDHRSLVPTRLHSEKREGGGPASQVPCGAPGRCIARSPRPPQTPACSCWGAWDMSGRVLDGGALSRGRSDAAACSAARSGTAAGGRTQPRPGHSRRRAAALCGEDRHRSPQQRWPWHDDGVHWTGAGAADWWSSCWRPWPTKLPSSNSSSVLAAPGPHLLAVAPGLAETGGKATRWAHIANRGRRPA